MGVRPATFQSGGQASQHYIPGGYSRLDFVKSTGGLVSINNVVIFGDCRGGQPNVIQWFTGAAEAEKVLRSGPLLDALRMAFRPGGDLVPQKIGAWRVNPGTKSSRQHLKGANPMITVSSWDWGLHANQIRSKLEAGSVQGKKLTISFTGQPDQVFDNIYRASIQLQYIGAGSACSMSISKTSLTSTVTGGPGGENLNLDFASFPTLQDLVSYINNGVAYTATVLDTVPTRASAELDYVNAQDIKTSAYTAVSNLQAIIDTYGLTAWATAVYYSSAVTREVPDNDSTPKYFTSGADGAYTASEWGASLTLAEQEDIQFIGASTDSNSIHALISAHCASMNSVTGKNERQFIVGGAAGETVAQAVSRAAALATSYGALAYPGFTHYDFTDPNKTTTYSPVYFAAKLLGMVSALALPEPMTSKDVDVLGWEKVLSTSEQESLIKGGVIGGYTNRAGRRVVLRSVNTYGGTDLLRCEFSTMREALFIARDLRTALEESFIGKAMSPTVIGMVDGVVIGKLSQYADLGMFTGRPPYWGYKKTIVGDQIQVEFDCYLTPPTNFIFITSHMHVYASTSG